MPSPEIRQKYQVVIGLEVHVQLLTQSKIFATEAFSFGSQPNVHISPITMAHPGALPSFNGQCLLHAIKLGLATDCTIARDTFFDRKNYFYPDLPKGYQLSQDRIPICSNGRLEIRLPDGSYKVVEIGRIHMEEDAGKSIHDQDAHASFIDLNRSGVGLVELVTRPDLRSPEEAGAFLAEIRKLVRYLQISDGNMEEGSLRCDANVSVMLKDTNTYGTRVEIKNINSISHVIKAITYEADRQIDVLESGGWLQQETRTWNFSTGTTAPMRDKEQADDYRYFPEPDLLPVRVAEEQLEEIRQQIPELPIQRMKRYTDQLGIPANESLTLVEQKDFSDYFEVLSRQLQDAKLAANWLLGPVRTWMNEENARISAFSVSMDHLINMIQLVNDGKIGRNAAREKLFPQMLLQPTVAPQKLAAELEIFLDTNTTELEEAVEALILQHPEETKKYRAGKKALMGFLCRANHATV